MRTGGPSGGGSPAGEAALAALRRTLGGLPVPDGRAALLAVALGQGRLWELCAVATGATPASAAAVACLSGAWSQALTREGFTLPFPPRAVEGVVPLASGVERLTEGALEVQARAFLPDYGEQPLEAVRALEAVRELSERAVLGLNDSLQEVLGTSSTQVEELTRVVKQFEDSGADGTASLSATLAALEKETQNLSYGLQETLARQRREAHDAASWAKDIIGLSASVDTLGVSARMLTFNARVESARMGDQGQGFVVIANAIGDLASGVRSSNDVVSRLASNLAGALPQLERDTDQLSRETEGRLRALRARLASVRTSFDAARATTLHGLRASEGAARSIHETSNRVIHDLQYQDRASQLLRHASGQVEALERALGAVEGTGPVRGDRVGELGRAVAGEAQVLQAGAVELF